MSDELALLNEYSSRWGLTLSRAAVERLREDRAEALRATGRAELGGGVLGALAAAFCDSPYIQSSDWESSLAELQDIFYEAKNDSEDRLPDGYLIKFMAKVFNGKAGGSLDYLSGTAIPYICREARAKNLPPDVDAFWEGGSVREDTARELLEGAAFTLELSGDCRALAPLDPDFRAALAPGVRRLEAEVKRGRELHARACLTAPEAQNRAYADTLKSIGGFFDRYDCRRFPLRVPCDIDYQLCRPVPEEDKGVFYVNEYLRRVIIENAFLRRFDPARTEALLRAYRPDYRELVVDLYEPVMTNALGLVLAGEEPAGLLLTRPGLEKLEALFRSLPAARTRAALTEAAGRLSRLMRLEPAEAEYLAAAAADLQPRVSAVLDAGGLSGVFLTEGR